MAEERNNKPGKVFTLLLFLFFYSITISWLAILSQGYTWGMDSLTNSLVPHSKIIYSVFILLFILYAYRTIIGAMKLAPWSVHALRISAIIFFLLLLQSPLRNQSAPNAVWAFCIQILLIVLLPYTFLSRGLKSRIPSRRLGRMGWMGLLLLAAAFMPLIWHMINQAMIMRRSMPVSVEELQLKDGELSDGLAVFRLNKGWEIDSIAVLAKGNRRLLLSNGTRIGSIVTTEVQSGYSLPRKAFQRMISRDMKNEEGYIRQKMTYSLDTIINGSPLCMGIYSLRKDTVQRKAAFAALFSKDSNKVLFLSQPGKDTVLSVGKKEILEFMETVSFDTEALLAP